MTDIKICSRCICDTSIKEILFDENGVCNFCELHEKFETIYPKGNKGEEILNKLVKKIKKSSKNKKYDCLVGLSGGTDSTFMLLWAVKQGLRPLAIFFDNGWSSEIAVSNIKNATKILNVDLHTIVADWEEMKDIQISFLKASVSDADAPSDYAIYTILHREAAKAGIKYYLNGHSFRAEGTVPKSWSYFDGKYIKAVHKKFRKIKIKSFPIMGLVEFFYYIFIKKIRDVRVLEYMDYEKSKAKEIIKKELNWIDYGGHHQENIFTRFFQYYYLPKKFEIDKRKIEYSARIRSGKMSRETALDIINTPSEYSNEDIVYVIKKLGFTNEELNQIIKTPNKTFQDYPNIYQLIKLLKFPIKLATQMHILPKIFYEKYVKM